MDLQQIWELAQRLIAEGRSRAEVSDRIKELTLSQLGTAMSLGQVERAAQPVVGAGKQLVRAVMAAPKVAGLAPKLIVRGLMASFDLPEAVVGYLAENEPKEVAKDLAKGVGAAADFIAQDVEEFGPGALIEAVGPIGKVGKVDDAIELLRLNRRTRGADPFERTGIAGAETRRRLDDPEGFRERLNFNVTDTGDPETLVAALPNRADFDIPRDRLYDLEADPQGIVKATQEELGNLQGTNLNVLEQRIEDAGFAGFLEPPARAGDVNQRAVVFEGSLPELERVAEAPVRLAQARDDAPFNIVQLTDEFGGSTVDPRTGRSLTGEDRWASSIGPAFEETSNKPLTETGVQEFIRRHQQYIDENPDVMVGTWFDEENRRYEINLTKTFESQREARNFGAANQQRAIMNLADPEFEAVKVGDSFANARLRARLDRTLPHRAEARNAAFRNALDEGELEVWDKMGQDVREGALEVYSLMPETEEGAALALVGAEAARWYQESAAPIHQMFGADAPRFLAITAALSPNAPVDRAFWAGLDMWGDWVKAGKPKNREWVEQTLDRLKSQYGVTPTNANNVERVLNVTDEALLEPGTLARGGIFGKQPIGAGLETKGATAFLSGMKIDPFWGNLMGQLQRYTMDTHMKSATGFVEQAAATKRQVIGATASARDQARFLTELTGKPWTAAETQAAQWAVIKNLKEMALEGVAVRSRAGQTKKLPKMLQELTGIPETIQWTDEVPATEFGELSQRIRNSPSLARFLHADEARPLLNRLGMEPPPLAENLSKLDFLDDPQVRFGDVMDAVIRVAQTNGQSLPAVAAMLVGQGVINQVQGRELLDAIGKAAGLNDVSQAAELDPGGTSDALQLMGEVPEASDDQIKALGNVRGRPAMEDVLRILRGGSQAAPATPEEEAESQAALRDSLTNIAGGGRFVVSRVPDILDQIIPKDADTQTAGIVFDLPFLRGTARIDPEFSENRGILAHEGGHILENLQPEEAAGINEALDVFLAGLDPKRREELAGSVVNRPPTDEALKSELFANLFREEVLTPTAPPSVEGTENVRQLFRQMIDRRINFPGIGT